MHFVVAESMLWLISCPSTGLSVDHNANDHGVEADSGGEDDDDEHANEG